MFLFVARIAYQFDFYTVCEETTGATALTRLTELNRWKILRIYIYKFSGIQQML